MYRIGEFSKLAKTTVKTLRYYESEGLICPKEKDKFTGYRLYSSEQLLSVHKIKSLRLIGLSVEEIKKIFSGEVSVNDSLQRRKEEIESTIDSSREQLRIVDFILHEREEERFMKYQAVIKELPECVVYSRKATIEHYEDLGEFICGTGEKVMRRYPDIKCI